jgi:large subunit ribosomal protein L27
MAKVKAKGTTKLGRDSKPKYLGVKISAGQMVNIGDIIIRQRGTKFLPGKNVKKGGDDTLYSLKQGVVKFMTTRKVLFTGCQKIKKIVTVVEK